MVATEVHPLGNHVERTVQAQLYVDRPVREVMASEQVRPQEDLPSHDPVGVVIPPVEQHALEAVRGKWRVGGHRVAECLDDGTPGVDSRLPAVREDYLWVRVQRLDAALEQIARVKVVVSSQLEQFPPRLADGEVLVWDQADIARLADVPYPAVLLQVALAELGCAVGRGVIRDKQLKVLVALAEQSLD